MSNSIKVMAAVLIVAGALALVYGGFSYTRRDKAASIGPVDLMVDKKERVNLPVWMGVGAILVGGSLLLVGNRKL